MYNTDYCLAAPMKYKKIWLTWILEASIRGHVKKDLKPMVKELCEIYNFNYRELNRKAIINYNRKVTVGLFVSNTLLSLRFRYFHIRWIFSHKLKAAQDFFQLK